MSFNIYCDCEHCLRIEEQENENARFVREKNSKCKKCKTTEHNKTYLIYNSILDTYFLCKSCAIDFCNKLCFEHNGSREKILKHFKKLFFYKENSYKKFILRDLAHLYIKTQYYTMYKSDNPFFKLNKTLSSKKFTGSYTMNYAIGSNLQYKYAKCKTKK